MAERGRPKGTLKYEDAMFIDMLDEIPRSTQEIITNFRDESGFDLSWNTADQYLKRLHKEGRIRYRKVGSVNLWMK